MRPPSSSNRRADRSEAHASRQPRGGLRRLHSNQAGAPTGPRGELTAASGSGAGSAPRETRRAGTPPPGWGGTPFSMATLGCTVTAVERSPVVYCLLRDGLSRARGCDSSPTREAAERITLLRGDSREVLAHLDAADAPDVVYLDPMYPPRKRASALAKKQMRILRILAGNDEDAGEVLDLARQVAHRRVVVKRQRHAPLLAPDRTVAHGGNTTRYDVYLPR